MADELRTFVRYETTNRRIRGRKKRREGRGGLGFLLIDVGFFFLLLFVLIRSYF